MPTWDNLIAQAQELVDDVVEDVPGAKGAWTIGDRYLSARKLRAIVDQGRERLHDAAQVLTDKEAKAALEGISEYITLLKDHSKFVRFIYPSITLGLEADSVEIGSTRQARN